MRSILVQSNIAEMYDLLPKNIAKIEDVTDEHSGGRVDKRKS